MGIGSKSDAESLFKYSLDLIRGFLDRGLQIIAYAADGSGIERSIQKILTQKANKRMNVNFTHPGDPFQKRQISIDIPLFGEKDQPVVMVQDSQHACKTARNNAFSGARMLTLGNYAVLFEDLRRMAEEGGPLFNRDVNKLDRQDDNAAIRLFSGDALAWMVKNHPELIGSIVFLFIFGEQIDSYQSREMKHIDRIKIAFRTLFFLEHWEAFLETAGYPKKEYFISKEARDIFGMICLGLISLVITYRNLPSVYPLIPHLISTEPCEHVFGLGRQILSDFTLLDFHFLIPKLFVQLRQFKLFGDVSKGNERASGYNHLYFDTRGVDLHHLSIYPTDDEIQDAIAVAHLEATNLWHILGFDPQIFWESKVQLPSIMSWFSDLEEPSLGQGDEDEAEAEDAIGSKLQNAVEVLDMARYDTIKEQDEAINLTLVTAGLSFQNSANL